MLKLTFIISQGQFVQPAVSHSHQQKQFKATTRIIPLVPTGLILEQAITPSDLVGNTVSLYFRGLHCSQRAPSACDSPPFYCHSFFPAVTLYNMLRRQKIKQHLETNKIIQPVVNINII